MLQHQPQAAGTLGLSMPGCFVLKEVQRGVQDPGAARHAAGTAACVSSIYFN